ncbi:MAG TPA: DnaJ domain-containing protein [Gammaproteobacteria bacterium]|nr:DnaJ domain-containing protein [Gammaproteobacteria bacterium]
MSGLDYYRILQIQPDAPAPMVHTSYQTLVRRALRDSPGGDEIARLDAAYAVLSDPQRRAAYDLERSGRTAARAVAEPGTCLFCGATYAVGGELKRDDECGRCFSPLYPADRHRLEYSGQRILGRIQVRHAISIWPKWAQETPISGEMRNVSLNGLSFTAPVLFEVNQIVRIGCTELHALGRIAHAEQVTGAAHPFSAGLEFLTLRLPEGGGTFYSPKK